MKNRLTVRDGAISFIIASVIILPLSVPLYKLFGAWYTAAAEILLALSALLYAKIRKADMREVFPLRLPDIRLTISSGIFFGGAFFVSQAMTYFVYAVAPSLFKNAEAESEVIAQLPVIYTVLAVALLPAVCEELLCRGLWLASLSRLKKDWLIALVSGLAFGALHFDLGKLFPIAVLGFAFSYMTLKTRSLIPSIICHYLNNIISVSSSRVESVDSDYSIVFSPATYAGSGLYYLGIGAALVFIAWFVAYKEKRRLKLALISIGLCFFITAFGIASSNLTSYHEICAADASMVAGDPTGAVPFSLDKDAEVVISSSAVAENGDISVSLFCNNEEIYSVSDSYINDAHTIFLEAGKYVIYYSLTSDELESDAKATVYVYVYQNGEYAVENENR